MIFFIAFGKQIFIFIKSLNFSVMDHQPFVKRLLCLHFLPLCLEPSRMCVRVLTGPCLRV